MKKQLLILFAFISVLALSQVPQRFNKVIVTGDITSPKFIKTGSTADSVLLGNGSARAISTIKTDTVSLSNRINAKATGTGTAYGTNTGDETLTSIKTKLGAATPVSDGYLKYQDWSIFNSKETAFSKNTGFNKNFGTTTGTVLEGRTFGTAAGSAVSDFIQNQNSSAQTGNLWVDGKVKSSFLDINAYTPYLTITSNQGTKDIYKLWSSYETTNDLYLRNETKNLNLLTFGLLGDATFGLTISATQLRSRIATGTAPLIVNSATMVSNFNADLLDGNHASAFQPTITGLSTNYIPKWNGSSFVNATAGTDYQRPITLTTNGTSGAATFIGNVLNVPNYGSATGSGSISSNVSYSYTNLTEVTPIYNIYSYCGNIVTQTISVTAKATNTGGIIILFIPAFTIKNASTVKYVGNAQVSGGAMVVASAVSGSDGNIKLTSDAIANVTYSISVTIQYEKQ